MASNSIEFKSLESEGINEFPVYREWVAGKLANLVKITSSNSATQIIINNTTELELIYLEHNNFNSAALKLSLHNWLTHFNKSTSERYIKTLHAFQNKCAAL